MTFSELLPAFRELPRVDKLRIIQWLASDGHRRMKVLEDER